MPEKLGNGGHSYEKYDPNTGKYVTDGQPNKYYDNPKEKSFANSSLKEKYKDFLNSVEENEELNALFGWKPKENKEYEKYTKPITEMSEEEWLTEIGEHIKWLEQNNVDLKVKSMNLDLKMKCANLREMHRLFEKYPFFKSLKHPVIIKERKMPKRYADCLMLNPNINTFKDYTGREYFVSSMFIFSDNIRLNPKYYNSYDKMSYSYKKDIRLKHHPDVSEDRLASCIFTHEFGHLLASHFIFQELPENMKIKEGKEIRSVEEHNYLCNLYNTTYDKFHDRVLNEIIEIYRKENPNLTENDFAKDTSGYAEEQGPVEWFAETFASLECGKPTKSALAMEKWLEQKMRLIKEV